MFSADLIGPDHGARKALDPAIPDFAVQRVPHRVHSHVQMQAGDVLLFLGNAVMYGATPWLSTHPRRVEGAMLDYLSEHVVLSRHPTDAKL